MSASRPTAALVVYSALGHLYTRPLPAGEPKRLTSAGADTYEFFPSFSRDGQWIVYTTWSDANQGRVRVIKLDGSAGRDVITRRSLRRAVVFARQEVHRLSARQRRLDARAFLPTMPEFTWCPRPRHVSSRESGSDPEFDHTARIYIREVRGEKYAPERRRADRRLAFARA